MLSCVNFNALWNSLCFLEKSWQTLCVLLSQKPIFLIWSQMCSFPQATHEPSKSFPSEKHKQWKYFEFPIILLKQESRVLSVDNSFPVFTGESPKILQAYPRNGQTNEIFFQVKYTDKGHVVSWNHMRFNEIRSKHYIFNCGSQVGQFFNSLAVVVLWKQLLLPWHFPTGDKGMRTHCHSSKKISCQLLAS